MAYLSTDATAGTPLNSTQPVGTAPFTGGSLSTLGNPAMGGFNMPTGSAPVAQMAPNGPGQTDQSFGGYTSDPVVQAIQAGLQNGLTGDTLIQFVKQRFPNANVSWDPIRGNVDYGTGGSSGLQIDTNAQGTWGVHPYNDAGMPGGGSVGGIGQGSLINRLPTAADAANMPGIQFALGEANRALQTGAAAKGTLLNERTQQGIGESLIGSALSQGYIPLSQLQLGYNQANVGNLMDLSKLGLSGVQTGNQ